MDFFSEALSLILSVFPVVWNWLGALWAAAGPTASNWLWAILFVNIAVRYIIGPIMGWQQASDKATAARAAKEKRDAEREARMGYYRDQRSFYQSKISFYKSRSK